ncbi:MAG: pesticidal protein Cry7Aa [Candidatus Fluviicola riflensis]|nr:MAG: pesticidal protein Cry7Aa [Candidatus Fluviicola riflensis]OGS78281.1 MAG: pesticidal protein Cry7Aa [Candidatus Fluviicola riflensis]OGS85347.1 MAG: pesticidal protein Cry7Aa [Fluviicola sp. RIFCSPHIGHO2_01_FULL_43_53]OGS87389.1 MAG: pesticidal protein Cry7Aa [Fluviicola sp. RIFCSPHIGHO2_12_FULL_43_24]
MLTVKREGVLLHKTALGFEDDGVLNPAIMQQGEYVHVFYRAVQAGNHSTIGYCKLLGPLTVIERHTVPLLVPTFDYEIKGIEDPRIVCIDKLYYLTYTAYDGWSARGALAVSKDLNIFEKKGMIVPQMSNNRFKQLISSNDAMNLRYLRFAAFENANVGVDSSEELLWDKNIVLFPRKINGRFAFFHRIRPDIQLVTVRKFEELTPDFWTDYLRHLSDHVVLKPLYNHEISYIGGGCPPIECKEGWVVIYHGVRNSPNGFVYSACGALLDLSDPRIEISRLPYPLFSPECDYEMEGAVNNVCFPTGTALFGDLLYIYYGAADERIACASVSFTALITELLLHSNPK